MVVILHGLFLLFVWCGCAGEGGGVVGPQGGGLLAGGANKAGIGVVKSDLPMYKDYIEALTLFGDRNPESWLLGEEKMRNLRVVYQARGYPDVFRNDFQLIGAAKDLDRKRAAEARTELARRGKVLNLLLDFDPQFDEAGAPRTPDFRRWEESRAELERIGVNHDAIDILVDILARRFLDARYESQYYFIREMLIRSGRPATDFLAMFVRELEERTGERQVNSRYERGVAQSLIVLAMSGKEGRAVAFSFAASGKTPIRRAAAMAFGETGDPADLDVLQKLLLDDPAWEVRARAAESVGKILSERSGLLLTNSLRRETDPAVLKAVIHAIVGVNDKRAVKDLVGLLERSADEDVRRWTVWALNALTGQRRELPEWWIDWWKTQSK